MKANILIQGMEGRGELQTRNRSPLNPMRKRRTRDAIIVFLTIAALTLVLTVPSLYAAASAPRDDEGTAAIAYEIAVAPDATQPVLFRLHMSASFDEQQFVFRSGATPFGVHPSELVTMTAVSTEGKLLSLKRSQDGYTVQPDGRPFYVEYELHLHPSVLNPETWPGSDTHSLRWDDYLYISGDTLLRPSSFPETGASIRVRTPEQWRVFIAGESSVVSEDTFHIADMDTLALVTGDALNLVANEQANVRVIQAGTLPWSAEDMLHSLSTMLQPLRSRGIAMKDTVYDFVVARYPGALRFNPFISGRAVSHGMFIHWFGVGSLDWWHKHTAAGIIAALVEDTLHLAPDATWFGAGLADYAGLLTLFEAGLLDVDGMHQSLYNTYATGIRYSGASWPSLLLAGLAEAGSHEAERVLQFRSPVIAFLLDIELRERSQGEVTLLDWWAALARRQMDAPEQPLHTEDLLPSARQFGDLSDFALAHIFESSGTLIDFDTAFDRWLQTQTQ